MLHTLTFGGMHDHIVLRFQMGGQVTGVVVVLQCTCLLGIFLDTHLRNDMAYEPQAPTTPEHTLQTTSRPSADLVKYSHTHEVIFTRKSAAIAWGQTMPIKNAIKPFKINTEAINRLIILGGTINRH